MIITSILMIVFSLLVMWLVYYFTLPVLSLAFISGFVFIAFCILIIVTNLFIFSILKDKEAFIAPIFIYGIMLLVSLVIGGIGSSTLINAETKRQQIGQINTDMKYEDLIKKIDTTQIPIVDEELAKKQADKKIGQDVALGSRVELGDAAIQEVNGEIKYVIPLEHSGFFKWNSNRSTPGYITVSASNPNKVDFVTEINGQNIQIMYQNSACFGNNLKRHIRNNGFKNVGLTEYTFEIDSEGRPYWVVTTYNNRTFWSSPEATGVVIVDAQTGETNWYSISETPEWVDIIQPKEFIETQIDNWGRLVHGVFNWSNQDKIRKTDLTLTVYVDDDCYYFTGMTSVGNDASCVGFVMTNTRNKETYMCYMSGATEEAAMNSAAGLVSDFGYTPTSPLPINANGIPTYVMALKDDEGLIKSYAMVNIENYSIAAKGSSLAETSKAYLQAVNRNSSTSVVASDDAYGYTIKGKVKRISSVVQDGFTYYYMTLENDNNTIYMASHTVSDELAITRENDTVVVSYIDDQNGTVDIVDFDNIDFATTTSKQQEHRNELDENLSVFDNENNLITEVNENKNEDTWNSLSEEEKAKLLEKYDKIK